MKLTPEILHTQDYTQVANIAHSELNAFWKNTPWKSSILKYFYWGIVLISFTNFIQLFWDSQVPFGQKLMYAGLGILLALAITPIHEFIHFIAYKMYGAAHVKMTPFLAQGYLLTQADQFVVSKKEIFWIAISPFLIITFSGFVILLNVPEQWQIFLSMMILFHITLCQTDFRIWDYFFGSTQPIFMYDDIKNGKTFVFEA